MRYIILVSIVVIIGIFFVFKTIKRKKSKELTEKLLSAWSRDSKIKYKEDGMGYISGYFKTRSDDKVFYIDDITWNDTGMEDIFKKINNTNSFVGENILYYLLRKPEFKSDLLDNRSKLMGLFSKDKNLRVNLQKILLTLGRDRLVNIIDYVELKDKSKLWKSIIYKLLSLFAIVSVGLTVYDLTLGLKFLVPSFIINQIVYHISKLEIGINLKAVNYIANLTNCARKISKNENKEIEEYTDKLSKLYKKVKVINNKILTISYNNEDEISQYIKILFLTDIINYHKISKDIYRYKEEIIEIYSILGELDALISVASYRDSLSYYSIPKLSNSKGKYLNLMDFYHPLVENPVTNSVDTKKSVLVTGSNASGKSTFLKSVAINAIFAQTMNLSLSKNHESSYFKILTSMALSDDVFKGESYYIVEIKSIKRIIDSIEAKIPTLCFVDEVLRGTNTIERISASSKILEHLSNNNCLCFTATHDIELASILKNNFDNYHFRERFDKGKINFDYKLYEGKSETRNAIKLLEIIGFDDEIVKSAEDLAKKYELTGKW